jgi:hypothetical protein
MKYGRVMVMVMVMVMVISIAAEEADKHKSACVSKEVKKSH